jgi:predicted small metal-binding protein
MKRFSCGAVIAGCTAHFSADTEQGVLEQVARHAREDHGVTDVSPELVAQVRGHITSA